MPQIPSSVTPLLSMMEVQWHKFFVAKDTLEPCILSSLMVANMKYPRNLLTYSEASSSNKNESEPYHQNQNKVEQCYGVVERYINTLMNLTGAPAHCWLLCLLYVCNLLNVTSSPALGGLTPTQALTGQVPDISHFLHFLGTCLLQGR